MKLRIMFPAFLLVLGVAFGGISPAHADYELWQPTIGENQNVFHFNLTPQNCSNELDLYINVQGAAQDFSPGAAGNALLLQMFPNQIYSGIAFNVEQTGGNWNVYNVTNGGHQFLLNLGASNLFGLYYKDYDHGNPYVLQPTISAVSGNSDQWVLSDGIDHCGSAAIIGAAPVPIPGALLLLGSSLAGVLGFRKRFQA